MPTKRKIKPPRKSKPSPCSIRSRVSPKQIASSWPEPPYFVVPEVLLSRWLQNIQLELARRAAAFKYDEAQIILGQEAAKRAVVVAAAGEHSLLLWGPPGCGKTLLRALAYRLGLLATFESWPCPCGHASDRFTACDCPDDELRAWRGRWPVAEMAVEVPSLSGREIEQLEALPLTARSGLDQLAEQVERARGAPPRRPSLALDEDCRNLLKAATTELGLSIAQHRSIKRVARTIARLDGAAALRASDVCEAIHYRLPDRRLLENHRKNSGIQAGDQPGAPQV